MANAAAAAHAAIAAGFKCCLVSLIPILQQITLNSINIFHHHPPESINCPPVGLDTVEGGGKPLDLGRRLRLAAGEAVAAAVVPDHVADEETEQGHGWSRTEQGQGQH